VRRFLTTEVVALDDAGETLTLGGTRDLDALAFGENVTWVDHLADFNGGTVLDVELAQKLFRLHARRGEVSCSGRVSRVTFTSWNASWAAE
jgi:hypothetical protein